MPLLTERLHAASSYAASSYLSPASTGSDPNNPWPSMPPFLYPDVPKAHRKSTTPPANDRHGLLFITGNTPADFKSKKNMTKVRKKAMGSYLEKEKKPKPSAQAQRPRLQSEESTGSRTSPGSDQQDDLDSLLSNTEALKIYRGERRSSSRRPASPIRSPASPSHDQQASSSDNQKRNKGVLSTETPRVRHPLDTSLPLAPIVHPMRTDVQLEYDHTVPRPFQSIGTPLDPFRTMFQAHHPRVSVEELKFHCSRVFGTRAMGQHWIPTLIASPHAFLSTLCIASAHLDAINERPIESLQTVALRLEVIHLIGQNMANPDSRVDDFNVVALTQLIASEMIAGEEAALSFHEAGVEAMVKQRGGVNQLGVNGRLASTVSWVSLESAILREERPLSIYSDFCASASPKTAYPPTATIPQSPLFCPRNNFATLKRSSRYLARTLDLLTDVRMMMDTFLHETKHGRQNNPTLMSFYKRITSHYLPISEIEKDTVLTPSDWTYEAIRVTSIIQATAIMKRIPLSEALKCAAQSQNPAPLYASSTASKSSESLVSPTATFCHDSLVTSFSTSPSYATSPAFSHSHAFHFFPGPPTSSSTASRPSISSMGSDFFFPAPAPPPPSGPNALLSALKSSIQKSDLSECWSDMAGVLLWIGLTVGAASRRSDKVLKKWFAALAIRCSIMLCFEHPEPVHATLMRMGEVVEGLGFREPEEVVEPSRGDGLGKKRRMI